VNIKVFQLQILFQKSDDLLARLVTLFQSSVLGLGTRSMKSVSLWKDFRLDFIWSWHCDNADREQRECL